MPMSAMQGVFRNFTAVAVNAHVLHDVDENHVAVEVIHNAAGCVRHGFQKRIMIRRPEVFRHARAVDIRLAVGRCHADGQLLQCAAVAAHGMSLEVGKHQHGIVIFQIFADKIFLDDLAVRDIQLHIGAFGVQQVYREVAAPAVLVHQLAVLLGGVAGAAIGSVALHDGAADVVDHRFPELRAKEILISLFTGMQLDCNVAGERLVHQLEHIQNLLRGDNRRKNKRLHSKKRTFNHLVDCIIIQPNPICKDFPSQRFSVEKRGWLWYSDFRQEIGGTHMNDRLLDYAIRIQSIAQAGLQYGKDKYDRERYEELRQIAAEMISAKRIFPWRKSAICSAMRLAIRPRKSIPEPLFLSTAKILLVHKITAHGVCPAAGATLTSPSRPTPKRKSGRKPEFTVTAQRLIAVQDWRKHNVANYVYRVVKCFVLCKYESGEFQKILKQPESACLAEMNSPSILPWKRPPGNRF